MKKPEPLITDTGSMSPLAVFVKAPAIWNKSALCRSSIAAAIVQTIRCRSVFACVSGPTRQPLHPVLRKHPVPTRRPGVCPRTRDDIAAHAAENVCI